VWGNLYDIGMGAIGGQVSDDERVAISAVQNYGGTYRAGHPSQLMPMEHTNLVGWNRPFFMSEANSWVPLCFWFHFGPRNCSELGSCLSYFQIYEVT
jgi:hypothetical protein